MRSKVVEVEIIAFGVPLALVDGRLETHDVVVVGSGKVEHIGGSMTQCANLHKVLCERRKVVNGELSLRTVVCR